jgi:methylated-DNA-protein-cysteine methyltransferase-like protein
VPDSLHERIYAAVRRIPRGRVATYGQIAREAGLPGQARLVGYALHNLPDHSDVPWHRVVNARGGISLDQIFGSGRLQRALLEAEDVIFTHDGRIDLTVYGWTKDPSLPAVE